MPRSEHVELSYGRSAIDYLTLVLSLIGVALCFVWRRQGDVRHAAEVPVGFWAPPEPPPDTAGPTADDEPDDDDPDDDESGDEDPDDESGDEDPDDDESGDDATSGGVVAEHDGSDAPEASRSGDGDDHR